MVRVTEAAVVGRTAYAEMTLLLGIQISIMFWIYISVLDCSIDVPQEQNLLYFQAATVV